MSETEKLLEEAVAVLRSMGIPQDYNYREIESLVDRIDAHLAKRDVVEVPREPTRIMLDAGNQAIDDCDDTIKDKAFYCYKAMLRAAQEEKS